MSNCCYQCSERHIGCHAECEKYKQLRVEIEICHREEKKRKGEEYLEYKSTSIARKYWSRKYQL